MASNGSYDLKARRSSEFQNLVDTGRDYPVESVRQVLAPLSNSLFNSALGEF